MLTNDEMGDMLARHSEQGELLADIAKMTRQPSKAREIGGYGGRSTSPDEDGAFVRALFQSRSRDYDEQRVGKAALEAMGSRYVEADSKATLGDTSAAGGNIVPPNMLAAIVEIATATNPYRKLLNIINAGFVSGVDIPSEDLAPTRATVQAFGATKTNYNFTASKYTATMYTLAQIFDVSNQLLRHSQGAAEKLVIDRLARGFALGESYYVLSGSGSSEPKGLLTCLAAASATFTTNKSAATTTPATSIAGTIVSGIKALALRSVQPTAIVLDPASYWTAFTDASTSFPVLGGLVGWEMNPVTVDNNGQPMLYGLPLIWDVNMPANTGIVADWKSATLFLGQTYRVDVSDVAGTRWDTNETGFRGECELAFTGDPAVNTGHFQRLTGLNT
jgi:HK97 family phage major capsid protein